MSMNYDFFDALESIASMLHSDEEDWNAAAYANNHEINRLADGLIQRNETFERKYIFDGEQIRCDDWDAVIHCGSYGHEDGLLEIMYPNGEVEGYLTADKIFDWFDDYRKWVK